MGELEPITKGQPPEVAPVIVFGGVMTEDWMHRLYAPLLGNNPDFPPASERFIPIPKRSLGSPDEMVERFEAEFLRIQERLGVPAVAVGHSLGGLAVEMVGVRHPNKLRAAVMLAGAQRGYAEMTPTMGLLQTVINMPREAAHMHSESDFIQEHSQNVRLNWSAEVDSYVIGAPWDDLLPLPQGMDVELPEGQTVTRLIVAPGYALPAIRRNRGIPTDTQVLDSRLPANHYMIPRTRSVVRLVENVVAGIPQIHPYLFDQHHWRGRAEWQLKRVSQEIPTSIAA